MHLLFLGPPGAGKGTQCQLLSGELNLTHLSSGDLLRASVAQNTKSGQMAKTYMDKGLLVPDEVLIAMFKEKLSDTSLETGYILDGFPRNLAQAQSFDIMLTDLNQKLDCVINLDMDSEPLMLRITGRRVCSNKACNKVYHIKFSPPKLDNICDSCGHELIIRADDKEDLVKVRLKTYFEQTQPLIDYYQKQKILVNIDASLATKDVFNRILNALKEVAKEH